MQSPASRTLTGAIVTGLVVVLLFLIVSTLMRYPMGESAGAPTPAAPEPAPAALEPAPAAEPVVGETTPDAASAPAAADPAAATDPQIAITLQPTPTRRGEEPAAAGAGESNAAAETAPAVEEVVEGVLPAPDAASPPQAPLLTFANANWINDVLLVGDTLWAATSGGAIRWDTTRATAESFGVAEGLAGAQLTTAVDCPLEGFGLIFGSPAGLQVLRAADQSWAQVVAGEDALHANNVTALTCSPAQGLLAVGYADQGVDLYRARQGRWSYTELPEGAGPGVQALAISAGGAVWAASGAVLVQIQGTRVTTITADDSPLTGEEITALAVDSDGALWVTAGDRLYRKQGETWDVYEERRVNGDFPAGVLVDLQPGQSGRVWVAGESGALCRFDPELESCTPYYAESEGMVAGSVTALTVNESGTVAYGTSGQGSGVLARSRWSSLALDGAFPAGNRIYALASDARGFVWAATNVGVQQFDPGRTGSSYLYTPAKDGVSATNVRALFADVTGGVWLGGIGASYFDGRRWTNYTQADGLAGDEITAIAQDSQGRVWFGTRTGLSIWTGTTFFNLTGENGLPDSEILSLAAEGESMWIGSANGGLYRFEKNQLQVLTQENVDLPSNTITALLVTADGGLIVGADNGLARIRAGEVQRLEALADERIVALARGVNGELWAATAASGLFLSWDGESWNAAEAGQGLLPNNIGALAVDLWNGVWMGSDSGLVRLATP